MKNIILTIALVLISLGVNAQNRIYSNPGPELKSILDSNEIFYVGILDRHLLSHNQDAYVYNDLKFLKKFDSMYEDNYFKTAPDTNNVVMKLNDFYEDKVWDTKGTYMAVTMTKDNSEIVGIKSFPTPNSYKYKMVTLYEVVIRGPFLNEFLTMAVGQNYDGTYSIIFDL